MRKEIFRYLRGELNGYYLTKIHEVLNEISLVKNWHEFLSYFKQMQFNPDKMDAKTINNIGVFAGVILPKTSSDNALIVHKLTESYKINGKEYSERGLYDTELAITKFFITGDGYFYGFSFYPSGDGDLNDAANEYLRSELVGDEEVIGFISETATDIFDENGRVKREKILDTPPENVSYTEFYGDKFLMLSENDGTDSDNWKRLRMSYDGSLSAESALFVLPASLERDINMLATPFLRSTLIGQEEVIGYISEDADDLFDEQGLVKSEKISSVAPTNKAFGEFYGDKFIPLSEGETDGALSAIPTEVYYELIKAFQKIKANGINLLSFAAITELLCPKGLVVTASPRLAASQNCYLVVYQANYDVDVENKETRVMVWEKVITQSFPQFILVEGEIIKTDGRAILTETSYNLLTETGEIIKIEEDYIV